MSPFFSHRSPPSHCTPSPGTPAHDHRINLTGKQTWLKTNLLFKSVTFPLKQPPAPRQWTAVPVSLPVTKRRDVTSKEMGTLRLWGQVHSNASLNSLWTHPLACTGMEPGAERYRKGRIIPRKKSWKWACKQRGEQLSWKLYFSATLSKLYLLYLNSVKLIPE